jgi:hypothetical protein
MENEEQMEDVGQTKSGPTMPNYVHRDTRAPISSEQEVQDGAAVVARTAEVEQEGQRHGRCGYSMAACQTIRRALQEPLAIQLQRVQLRRYGQLQVAAERC